MKLAAYTRVSTEEQVKSGSLEQQKEQISDFCRLHKHELVKVFIDAGISAVKDRPDMAKLMKFLNEGKAEGVIVTKLDRWGRSVKHLVTSVDELKQQDLHFISIGDKIDTSSANGRLMFHILSAFAEFEREIIRERMQSGRERARAEGKKLHRPRKELDIREIKRLYAEVGLSATAIAKLMQVAPATILSRLREIGVKIK